jgi:hypothetical protein
VGFRPECPDGWLGNSSVDVLTAGCDRELVGIGWSAPHFELPMLTSGLSTSSRGIKLLLLANYTMQLRRFASQLIVTDVGQAEHGAKSFI